MLILLSFLTILPHLVCGSVLIWFFIGTVNWHVTVISVVFLFILKCYPIWAAIPSGVVLQIIYLCYNCTFSGVSLFTHSMYVSHFVLLCVLSKCFRMSSSVFTVLLLNWSWRYCSAVMDVAFTWVHFLVISQLTFMIHIMYDLLLWLWFHPPSTVPWVHSPPSSHWTTTVHPNRKEVLFLEVSWFLSSLVCLLTSTS